MFCTKCGKKIDEDASFCSNCGQPKEENEKKRVNHKKQNKEEKSSIEPNEMINPQSSMEIKQNEQTAPTAIASLVIGVISFAFCFLFSIIMLPLSIAGFCLGIATKQKSAIKVIGIILNIISAIISIIIFILFGTLIIMFFVNILKNIDNNFDQPISENKVEGAWYCKDSAGIINNGDNVFALWLEDNYDFSYFTFGEAPEYDVEGTYSYTESSKTSTPKYKYYDLYFETDKYIENGYKQSKDFNPGFKIGVDEYNDEAVIIDKESNTRYICSR